MAAYFVTYDLRNKAEWGDYEELIGEIETIGGFRAQASVWLVSSSRTAGQLFTYLRDFMHDDDFLFIAAIEDGGSWRSASRKGTNAWMIHNIGASD